jgi:hypothetical protein
MRAESASAEGNPLRNNKNIDISIYYTKLDQMVMTTIITNFLANP